MAISKILILVGMKFGGIWVSSMCVPGVYPSGHPGRPSIIRVPIAPSKHIPVALLAAEGFNILVPSNDEFVSRYVQITGTFDPVELDFILQRVFRDANVIEVGCNIGSYSIHIADKIGSGGSLYCFEPFRLVYQILTANIALNGLSNVHTFQQGVSNVSESGRIVAGPDLNSKDNYGAASLLEDEAKTWILSNPQLQSVDISTLDSLIFTRKVDFIKMDVEGMEFHVLRGAMNLISRDRPIVYAENSREKTDGGLSFEQFMLKMFNYECSRPEELETHNIVFCLSRD